MSRTTSLLVRFALCLPMLAGFSLASSQTYAATSTIACTGIGSEDPQCTLSGNTSEGFINIIKDVLDSIENQQVSQGVCVRDFGQDQTSNSFTCTLPASAPGAAPLTLQCTDTSSGADCQLPDLDPDFFSLNCTAGDGSGECVLDSDEAAVRERLTSIGLTRNAASVGANLLAGCALRAGYVDDQATAFQRDCDALLTLLSNGQNAQAAALVEEITPQNVDVAIDTTAQMITQQLDGVASRMSRLRQNQRGLDVAGLQFFDGLHWISADNLLASNDPVAVDAPPVVSFADSRLGVFLDGAVLSGSQDEDNGGIEGETDYDGQNITLGIDYRINDAWIAGVAYSLGFTSTDFSGDRGSLDSNGYTLIGYTTYYRDAWYVEGTFALGSDRYEQDRRMNCDVLTCGVAFDVTATSEYYGDQTAITLGGGYAFTFNALTITPNLQWSEMSIETDSYRETTTATGTGAGFLLEMDDQSRDHSTVSVGVDTSYAISTSYGVVLPHVSLDLRNELDDEALVVNGRFMGGTANNDDFALSTRELDSSYYVLGVGTSLQMSGGNSGYVDVKSLLGYDDVSQWQIRAGWRWEM